MHMSNRFPLLPSLIYEEKSKISRVYFFSSEVIDFIQNDFHDAGNTLQNG